MKQLNYNRPIRLTPSYFTPNYLTLPDDSLVEVKPEPIKGTIFSKQQEQFEHSYGELSDNFFEKYIAVKNQKPTFTQSCKGGWNTFCEGVRHSFGIQQFPATQSDAIKKGFQIFGVALGATVFSPVVLPVSAIVLVTHICKCASTIEPSPFAKSLQQIEPKPSVEQFQQFSSESLKNFPPIERLQQCERSKEVAKKHFSMCIQSIYDIQLSDNSSPDVCSEANSVIHDDNLSELSSSDKVTSVRKSIVHSQLVAEMKPLQTNIHNKQTFTQIPSGNHTPILKQINPLTHK